MAQCPAEPMTTVDDKCYPAFVPSVPATASRRLCSAPIYDLPSSSPSVSATPHSRIRQGLGLPQDSGCLQAQESSRARVFLGTTGSTSCTAHVAYKSNYLTVAFKPVQDRQFAQKNVELTQFNVLRGRASRRYKAFHNQFTVTSPWLIHMKIQQAPKHTLTQEEYKEWTPTAVSSNDIGQTEAGSDREKEDEALDQIVKIKVIGVGGGGSNAVNRMIACDLMGVEYLVVNTDAQALLSSHSKNRLQIGSRLTRGLGTGGDPSLGSKSAEESKEMIRDSIEGADMVFITAGMGGGTGSGASPVIARLAREMGKLTIGIVTFPFTWEGKRRQKQAAESLEVLRQNVDAAIVISNDKLLRIVGDSARLNEAFRVADDVLRQGVQGVSDIITVPGLVNVDFADVRSVLSNSGSALLGVGMASGKSRAQDAAETAVSSPLLEFPLARATGIVVNVSGGEDLTLGEVQTAAEVVYRMADPDANIIFGAVIDEKLEGTIRVTVIAAGFESVGLGPGSGARRAATTDVSATQKNRSVRSGGATGLAAAFPGLFDGSSPSSGSPPSGNSEGQPADSDRPNIFPTIDWNN